MGSWGSSSGLHTLFGSCGFAGLGVLELRCVDTSVQGTGASSLSRIPIYRLHCSSRSCGLNLGSYKVLPRKELEWSLWVGRLGLGFWGGGGVGFS